VHFTEVDWSAPEADQKRTKDTEQKTTTMKVKELFVSSSGSAKPLYVGSNPTRASKLFNSNGLGSTSRLKTSAVLASRRTKSGPPKPIISIWTVLLLFKTDLSVADLFPSTTCYGRSREEIENVFSSLVPALPKSELQSRNHKGHPIPRSSSDRALTLAVILSRRSGGAFQPAWACAIILIGVQVE
jgi:hypothetical protein